MERFELRHSTYDVVIIGARCAGAALAIELARGGLRVLAVDRATAGSDTLSTHALMRPAVELLARWGVLDAVRREAPGIRASRFVYGDEATEVEIERRGEVDALYAPRRNLLDAILARAARDAGAEVAHQVSLRALRRATDGRVVGVELEDALGRRHAVSCALVVGADGARSTVARLVGAATRARWAHAATYVYAHVPDDGRVMARRAERRAGDDEAAESAAVTEGTATTTAATEGRRRDAYTWRYERGLFAGEIPTNGGTCVFVAAPREAVRSVSPRALLGDGARRFGLAIPGLGSDFSPRLFRGTPGFLREAIGPGWALVGDAAAFRDPATAHGMTDALRDALLLGSAILDGELGRYDEARVALGAPIIEISDRFASFAWDLDEARALHLALARAMRPEQRLVASLPRREPTSPVDQVAPRPRVASGDQVASRPRERASTVDVLGRGVDPIEGHPRGLLRLEDALGVRRLVEAEHSPTVLREVRPQEADLPKLEAPARPRLELRDRLEGHGRVERALHDHQLHRSPRARS